MRTWTGNEVLELGQPQCKEEKQRVRFIEDVGILGEIAESIRVNPINKRKCREKRRGLLQTLVLRGKRKKMSQERWLGKELLEEGATQAKKQDVPWRLWYGRITTWEGFCWIWRLGVESSWILGKISCPLSKWYLEHIVGQKESVKRSGRFKKSKKSGLMKWEGSRIQN